MRAWAHIPSLAWIQGRQGSRDFGRSSFWVDADSSIDRVSYLVCYFSSNEIRFCCLNGRGTRITHCGCRDRAFRKSRHASGLLLRIPSRCHSVATSLKYLSVNERHRAKFSPQVKIQSTTILGTGSWGTALATLWGKDGRDLQLWGRNQSLVEQLDATRENTRYLPTVQIPKSVRITNDLSSSAKADLIVFVTPSTGLRAIADQVRGSEPTKSAILLSCAKGIEHGTGMRMSEILREYFPENPIAVLSGPNLAVEVVRGLPTATVVACTAPQCALELQSYLGSARFRIYTGDELTGIELGGALKNIFALAAGVSDGFGLGDNTKAALLTRSLAEMIRLGSAMGGKVATFYGLSGIGDLIATSYSSHSRNRRVGERLGAGESLEKITSSMQMVAEGVPTTKSAYECARRLNIETPIIDQIYAALYEGKPFPRAMEELLSRDQKAEGF